MIVELEYKGKLKGKECTICKTILSKDDTILFCPTCESLLHEEHLLDWLALKSECPVCKGDFSQIVEKYSIRELYMDNVIESVTNDKSSNIRLHYINSHSKQNPRRTLILYVIVGTLFGIVPITLCSFLLDFKYVVNLAFFCFLFFIYGFHIVIDGLAYTKNNFSLSWDNFTFTVSGVIIEKLDSSIIKIWPEDIDSINLYRYYSRGKIASRAYFLNLELVTLKKEKINFGIIYGNIGQNKRDQRFYQLRSQIKTLYNIKPNSFGFNIKKTLKRTIVILFSIICYISILAPLLAINYYLI